MNAKFNKKMNPARFVIGERVNFVNHVMEYSIGLMEVTKVDKSGVFARRFFGGKELKFGADGIASWSCNLSIQKQA